MAALPKELVESILFGHTKGSFTGADQAQNGCCEAADQGTLFLDEIAEMEIGPQAKILRFLQERSFQRVGQSAPVSVDVRIVAATNRDPLEQIRKGQLREDLYYRLNVVPIVVPPLRERRDDIPQLATHFLKRACERHRRPACEFSESAMEELVRRSWPGNIRELENFVERVAILSSGPIVGVDAIRDEHLEAHRPPPQPTPIETIEPSAPRQTELREIDRIEKDAIARALAATRGNVGEAAKMLGLGQATVYRKIKKYHIPL
jgi:DNA-binding NtrC family response regulator